MTLRGLKFSPFLLSVLIHGVLIASLTFFPDLNTGTGKDLPVEIIEYPIAVQSHSQGKRSHPESRPQAKTKSLREEVSDAPNKANETMSTNLNPTADQTNTNPNGEGSSAPADARLVTSMPVLISEVRIPYPTQAQQAGIEGPVVMDLLIDAQGKVRQVILIRGPGYGLNEAALEAIQKVSFRPARIQDKNVAVKIRYTYRFILEHK